MARETKESYIESIADLILNQSNYRNRFDLLGEILVKLPKKTLVKIARDLGMPSLQDE